VACVLPHDRHHPTLILHVGMLHRTGDMSWAHFKALYQQRFGSTLGIIHLVDLAQLPFRGTIDEYMGSFQTHMAHTGNLTQVQQVHLFTYGLPDAIHIHVELQAGMPPRLAACHGVGVCLWVSCHGVVITRCAMFAARPVLPARTIGPNRCQQHSLRCLVI
jgi:hypothetical protein